MRKRDRNNDFLHLRTLDLGPRTSNPANRPTYCTAAAFLMGKFQVSESSIVIALFPIQQKDSIEPLKRTIFL